MAADISVSDTSDETRKSSRVTCPSNIHILSKAQLEKLPAECKTDDDNALWPWAIVGLAAVASGVIGYALNDDGGHHHTDNGGNTPVPPDDGGDTPLPPDNGGGTPVPPNDGGNAPIKFNNNVTLDKDAKTVQIRDMVLTYSQNDDGTFTLTGPNGKTTLVTDWQVDTASNTVTINGVNTAGGISWSYDNNGKIHITKEAGVVSDGTTGEIIKVHDAIITDQGGNTAINGGTVMIVDGNNITLNNNGKTTAMGEGSVVGFLNGNDITINNNGETEVNGGTAVIVNGDRVTLNNAGDSVISNGGTGSIITGDDARVDNQGKMTVDGENSVGSKIVGDDSTIKQEGDLYVSGGAHGIDVAGNGTMVSNKGNITVVDTKSIGVVLEGDETTFINMGDISASNGTGDVDAVGVQIAGDGTTFMNVGDIKAKDSGVGVRVTGDNGNISLAGGLHVGDFSTGLDVIGNNNKMTLSTYELGVTGEEGTGVNVTGDGNTIAITGNILVDKDQSAENAAEHFFDPSAGVDISGNNNNVTLDGQLTMIVDSETTNSQYAKFDGTQENISGIVVAGNGNTITLNGGIQLQGETNALTAGEEISAARRGLGNTPLIAVDGQSTVYLNGDSTVNGEFLLGYGDIIQLSNDATLEIGEGASFSTHGVDLYEHYYISTPAIIYADSGSQIINKGDVDIENIKFIHISDPDTTATNSGNITLLQYDYSSPSNPTPEPGGMALESLFGATVTNSGTITAKVMEQGSVLNMKAATGLTSVDIPNNKTESMIGMAAYGGSFAFNSESGVIDMFGRGNIGMAAIDNSTAENDGEIILDTLWIDESDTTQLRSDIPADTARDYGAGMSVGTDAYDGARKGAVAINQQGASITIYNAGAGMVAYGTGNEVVNQGTINLEQNDNYDDSLGENRLVGMAVYEGGTAINDQTGVININAQAGQAFYNDGKGTIVNYGTICTFGICQQGNDYNATDDFTSLIYTGGDTLAINGGSQTLAKAATVTDGKTGSVVNSGTLSGELINIISGELDNTIDGVINNNITVSGGTLSNDGSVAKITLVSGVINNNGTVNSRISQSGGTFNNQQDGTVKNGSRLSNDAVVNNDGTWYLGSSSGGNNGGMLEINNNSVFNNGGEFILDNSKNAVHINQAGTLSNTGHMSLTSSSNNGAVNIWGGTGSFINSGTVDATAKAVAVSASNASASDAFFWNQQSGVINYDRDSGRAVKFTHNNYVALNDGTMNISGNSAVAMEGDKNAQLVNNGVINLGMQGTADTGMIGMQLDANATADAVIENNGTINIYASDSYAFSMLGTQGHIVNNGTVVIADGVTGSGLIKQGDSVNVEGVNGNNGNNSEVHYADYTLPNVSVSSAVSTSTTNNLNGYVVGTSADGSAGKLKVNNASMNGVGINTGFAAGTAETTVSFDNVVEGSNLTDAQAITSTSVVWTAQGSTDADGNVDVTMSKNAYTDVATDASVNAVTKALDAGYTNNELYTSLNVGSSSELNSALKQISGSQATTVFREARVLSNRFSMLADAAPKVGNGLAFNVVAKGDPRAELGNNTEYDMLALRKTLALSESQSLSVEYGIARLDGDGSQKAGDNGVTGGYSQFFGLKHQLTFDNGMSWNNALRYDVHNLDSSRSVAYGDVSKTADTDVKQQYLELRSEGAKTFEPRAGLKITPYAGVKLRHTLEGGYQERNAGDFNLRMDSGSETAVDSIVGLKLDYAGKDGWSANMTLEGGPNLSYAKSQRTAGIAGAGSQRFNVDDGQKGGGVNSLASVGVKYSSKESSLDLDAYHWKEDGISDKGVMLNFKKMF